MPMYIDAEPETLFISFRMEIRKTKMRFGAKDSAINSYSYKSHWPAFLAGCFVLVLGRDPEKNAI